LEGAVKPYDYPDPSEFEDGEVLTTNPTTADHILASAKVYDEFTLWAASGRPLRLMRRGPRREANGSIWYTCTSHGTEWFLHEGDMARVGMTKLVKGFVYPEEA